MYTFLGALWRLYYYGSRGDFSRTCRTVLSLYTLSLVQARLKRRNFLAAVVSHFAVGRVHRRAFGSLKAIVVFEVKRRQVGQLRELFRDAAWHRGTF